MSLLNSFIPSMTILKPFLQLLPIKMPCTQSQNAYLDAMVAEIHQDLLFIALKYITRGIHYKKSDQSQRHIQHRRCSHFTDARNSTLGNAHFRNVQESHVAESVKLNLMSQLSETCGRVTLRKVIILIYFLTFLNVYLPNVMKNRIWNDKFQLSATCSSRRHEKLTH